MTEELITYLESIIQIHPDNLRDSAEDRHFLLGQLNVIDKIKDIAERGYPDEAE